jgi:hypothetical protein
MDDGEPLAALEQLGGDVFKQDRFTRARLAGDVEVPCSRILV